MRTERQLRDHICVRHTGKLQAVALAYADSVVREGKEYDWKTISAVRNLDFAGEYTDAETFLRQVAIIGNYNFFNTDIARDIVAAMPKDTQYRLAREGSVAVYIKTGKEFVEVLRDISEADEIDHNRGELRMWWD